MPHFREIDPGRPLRHERPDSADDARLSGRGGTSEREIAAMPVPRNVEFVLRRF